MADNSQESETTPTGTHHKRSSNMSGTTQEPLSDDSSSAARYPELLQSHNVELRELAQDQNHTILYQPQSSFGKIAVMGEDDISWWLDYSESAFAVASFWVEQYQEALEKDEQKELQKSNHTHNRKRQRNDKNHPNRRSSLKEHFQWLPTMAELVMAREKSMKQGIMSASVDIKKMKDDPFLSLHGKLYQWKVKYEMEVEPGFAPNFAAFRQELDDVASHGSSGPMPQGMVLTLSIKNVADCNTYFGLPLIDKLLSPSSNTTSKNEKDSTWWEEWIHIKCSRLRNANGQRGVFAARHFPKGALIGYYCGRVTASTLVAGQTWTSAEIERLSCLSGPYTVTVRDQSGFQHLLEPCMLRTGHSGNVCVDGFLSNFMGLHYINDCMADHPETTLYEDDLEQDAYILQRIEQAKKINVTIQEDGSVVATQDIEPGDEIYSGSPLSQEDDGVLPREESTCKTGATNPMTTKEPKPPRKSLQDDRQMGGEESPSRPRGRPPKDHKWDPLASRYVPIAEPSESIERYVSDECDGNQEQKRRAQAGHINKGQANKNVNGSPRRVSHLGTDVANNEQTTKDRKRKHLKPPEAGLKSAAPPKFALGTCIRKGFYNPDTGKGEFYSGEVRAFDKLKQSDGSTIVRYLIQYSDGDSEHMSEEELESLVSSDEQSVS